MTGLISVVVPVTREQAGELESGTPLTAPAYAATPALLQAHDIDASDEEDASYTALGYAGLGALLSTTGLRLVLAADVASDQVRRDDESPFGEVDVTGLRWDQVQALFADEAGAAADLDAAREVAAGRSLAEVAEDDAVLELVDRWDLLWFATQELADLPLPG